MPPDEPLMATPAPAEPAVNPYDAVVVDLDRSQSQQARTNLVAAQGSNPSTTARAIAVSKHLNVPVDVAERNLLDFEAIDNVNRYDQLLRESPRLRKWLADPVNARVAGDDLPKLAGTESILRGLFDTIVRAPAGEAVGFVGSTLYGLGEAFDVAARTTGRLRDAAGVPSTGVALPWYLDPAQILKRPGKSIKEFGHDIGVPQERQNLADQIVGGVGQIGAQIAALVATGGVGGLALLFGQGVDQMADDVEKAGKSGSFKGDLALVGGGLVTAISEKIGLDLLVKRLPPAIKNRYIRVVADLAAAGGIEAAEEVIEQIGHNALSNYYLGTNKHLLEGAGDQALAAGGSAALVRGMLLGGGRLRNRNRGSGEPQADLPPAEASAEMAAAAIDRAAAMVQSTQLAGLSPEKLEEVIGTLVGDPDRNIFVPAEVVGTYLQGLPNEQAMALIDRLGIGVQLGRAGLTNEDIAIPLAKYIAADTALHAAWRQDIRTEVDGFSIRQAQEWEKTRAEETKAAIARFEVQVQAGVAEVDPQVRVFEHVRDQLRIAGKFTNEVSAQYAALYAARYGARAARSPGRYADAWDAFQQAGSGRGVRFETVLPDGTRALGPDHLDVMLDSIRTGKDPLQPPALDSHVDARREAAATELDAVLPAPPEAPRTPAQQAADRRTTAMEAFRARRQDVADALHSMGLDVAKLTNAQIRAAVEKAHADRSAGRSYEQSASARIHTAARIAPPFFSGVERAVEGARQAKATPQQWLGMLKNAAGVKPEEMKWLGLEEWLGQQRGTVTKEQVAEFIRANKIEVREVENSHSGPDVLPTLDEIRRADSTAFEVLERNGLKPVLDGDGTGLAFFHEASGEHFTVRQLDARAEFPDDAVDAAGRVLAAFEKDTPGSTRYGVYTLPGGENYRELLLTLPQTRRVGRRAAELLERSGTKPGTAAHSMATLDARLAAVDEVGRPYISSHWDEPNVLAHVRFNDRVIDGKRTLLIEEVQSDWHQAGRKYGYAGEEMPIQRALREERERLQTRIAEIQNTATDPLESIPEFRTARDRIALLDRDLGDVRFGGRVPDAPLKTTWPEFAMKRMIRYAADHGYEKIAWVPGDVQVERFPSAPIEGMRGFYDKMLPSIVNKLVKKFGAKVGSEEIRVAPDAGFRIENRGGRGGEAWRIVDGREGYDEYVGHVFASREAAETWLQQNRGQDTKVHTLDITSELRTAALEQGFTLFQDRPPVAVVRGDELGPPGPLSGQQLKDLRKAARDHWKAGIRGTKVVHLVLGEVSFSRSGEGEFFTYSADPDKLRLVPALREIVAGATFIETTPHESRGRGDNVLAYHWMEADVAIGDRVFAVGITVFEDIAGNKFYNLTTAPDSTKGAKSTDTKGRLRAPSGGKSGPGDKTGGSTHEQKIGIAPDGVNLVILDQAARGSITFGENGAIIRLFQERDLSTLIHESGHLWLNELEFDAKDATATEQTKADWQAVLDFVGSTDGYITREQHELFARAFEAYTMEGKAPSEGLRGAFRSFKNWLIGIYRQLTRLQAPISPEMRQVFDRMLATEEEIANAKNTQGLNPVFTDAKSGEMTEAEFKAYTRAVNQADNETEQKLTEKAMASLRRERTKEVAAERKKIRADVATELMKDPGNAALHFLRTGSLWEAETPEILKGRKMVRAALVEMLGEDGLRTLPVGSYAESGMHPDDMAQLFGLANGRELTERLMQIQAEQAAMRARGDGRSVINARVAEETQRRLTETLGDPLNDGSIEAEAVAAVNGEKRGPLLGIELRMLARKAGHAGAISIGDITKWAADTIGAMSSYQAVQFAKYQRAERTAGQRVQRALIKGDMQAAFLAKQDQVVNWALYREAQKAAEDTEKTRKLADRYASARTISNMDQPTLEAIHEILEEFDFKRRSGSLLAERTLFTAWATQQAANGVEVMEPPRLKGAESRHYSQLTMEELRGLHDTIAQMAHLGRWKKEMIVAGKKRELDAVLTEMEDAAGAISQRGVSQFRRGQTELQKVMGEAGHQFRSGVAALIKMERLFEILDNDKTGRGIFSQTIFRRLADAQTVEYDMRVDLNKKLEAIYAKVPKEQLKAWSEAHTVRDLGARLTKEEMIVVALNIGSQSNLDKMLQGEDWGEAPMRAMLDKYLTKEEWQFTQDIRDLIGSLWPQTEALEKRVNGFAPEKVEALEVPTPHGTLAGGYYPMVYDRAGSLKADKIARKQATTVAVGELFASGYARPSVRAGSTHERIESFNAPLKLSLSTIGQHINEVSHDIASREAVMDIFKIITNDRFRTAVQSAVGVEYEAQMLPWLQRIANEWVQDRVGLDGIDKFLKTARMNTTLVGMGYRISTMLSQVAGYANSVQRLGVAGMADGMRTLAQDPKAMADTVFAKSGEMRNRMNTLERDARANMERFQGKDGITAGVGRYAFRGIALFDMAVSLPTWVGAYNQGLKQGMTEEEAVYYGDKMVRDTQGAGGAKDMSSVQSGSEAWKLFTMFYSYFNVYFNAQIGLRNDLRNAETFSDYMDVAAQTMWLMVIPTLLAAMLSGQGPEKDEELWAWALRNIGFGVFSGVPYARDLGNAASNQIAGKGFGGAKLSPVQGIGDSVLHLGGDIAKLTKGEDVSKSAIKNIFNFAGLFAGLPTGQLGATSQYVWDVLITGSENPRTALEWLKGLTYGPEHKK